MASVFLSYARGDLVWAEGLARVFEQAGHRVWWDRHIDSGAEFGAEIEAALDAADVVVVAWSKASVTSRWVRDEAGVGGDTGRLVPVTIDGSLPPMGFRQFQTLDLVGWKGDQKDGRTGQLLQAIERRLKDKPAVAAAPPTPIKRRFSVGAVRPIWAVAAVLALVIAAGIIWWSRERTLDAPIRPKIALVPFSAPSSDGELKELANQARDSLAHTFSQSGLPVRVLNAAPAGDRSGVDFIVSGDLSRKGQKVIATVRLDEAAQGVTVYSQQFEATSDQVRDLPERIGAQVAGNLLWGAPLMMLDRRHPMDTALMAELMKGYDFNGDLLQAYQNSKRVAAKAPDLAIAQISVAFETAFVLDEIPRGERAEVIADARSAADRALKLAPHFGDIYGNWCLFHSETRFAECEDRLRAGRRIDPDAPFLNSFLSSLLQNVGRFDEAAELARLSYTHNSYVPTKIAWMLGTFELAGEKDAARDLYQLGARWWPEFKRRFFSNRLSGLIERGDFAAMPRLEQEAGALNWPTGYAPSGALAAAIKAKSLAGAKQACAGNDGFFMQTRCMVALASLGDQDGAYIIADKLYPRRIGRTPAETEHIWLDDPDGTAPLGFITSPAAAPLRRDPRYLALVERVGLMAYWRTGRPPDFCRKQPEPICAHIGKPG